MDNTRRIIKVDAQIENWLGLLYPSTAAQITKGTRFVLKIPKNQSNEFYLPEPQSFVNESGRPITFLYLPSDI